MHDAPIRTFHPPLASALEIAVTLALVFAPARTAGQPSPAASPASGAADAWLNGAPCYEVFVRSFQDSDGDGTGDFNSLAERLVYLNDGRAGGRDPGVTCVWLMPIMNSTSYHGYDVTDYRNAEPDYGSEADFIALTDAAYQRAIRVIIDLVINHSSVEHPWFQDAIGNPRSPYRDWYSFSPDGPGYRGPWGDVAWHPIPDGTG